MSGRRWLFLAMACLGAAFLVLRFPDGDAEAPGEPALLLKSIDEGWPTEMLNGEAGPTKGVVKAALRTGRLAKGEAFRVMSEGFLGEDFAARARRLESVQTGIRVESWEAAAADQDRVSFVRSFNRYLAGFSQLISLEWHTWEIQLLEAPAGETGLETKEAIWILGRLADGRLREDRLLLVFELSESEGTKDWRITRIRSEQGRTTIGPGPYFRDVTAQVLPPGYDQIGAQVYTDGGPVLADIDADGDTDLFLPRLHGPARLYANDGTGHFEDVTGGWGLELNALREGSNSGIFFDHDGDGRLDLVVGLKRKGLRLFRNEGTLFRDVTGPQGPLAGPGEWESLAVADHDGDGRLDIYACNYNRIDTDHQPESYVDARDGLPNVLLRNEGAGAFRDVTKEAGLAPNRTRWSYAAAWADYDRDGDMDLYVANDYGPNSLYRNLGAGRFEEVAFHLGAEDHGNGMGVSWVDFDGDLLLDLYVSNMQSAAGNRITRLKHFPGGAERARLYRRFSQGNTLLRNRGDGTFEDWTDRAGVKPAFWAWGNVAFDADADADVDLFCCAGFYTGASAKDT